MTPKMVTDGDGNRFILTPIRNPDDTIWVGREYAAEVLGVTASTISRQPWSFPDYGARFHAGRIGERPYTKAEMDKWLAIPHRKRKEMYENRGKEN